MHVRVLAMAISVAMAGCRHARPVAVSGPFTQAELKEFTSLDPIDAHTHVFADDPSYSDLVTSLNFRLLDIVVLDDTNSARNNLGREHDAAWRIAQASGGRIAVATTFDPFRFNQPDFASVAIQQINQDFDRGAVAVKIWKNIGMELKDEKGDYVMIDDPRFQPILDDIAAHNKTVIAHVADPDAAWQKPNPRTITYKQYQDNPQWLMYGKAGGPSKARLIEARDHVLARNPNLRWVGAHMGSMEDDLVMLADHLDRYPNYAVDLAARVSWLMRRPRKEVIAFITKYQDRLIYGTDTEIGFGESPRDPSSTPMKDNTARVWRYFATNDTLTFSYYTIQGLGLQQSIVRKIYHDNAIRWFPGIAQAAISTAPRPKVLLARAN